MPYAQHDHAQVLDLPLVPQQFEQSEREQASSQMVQRLVYVGDRQRKSHSLPPRLRNPGQIGNQNLLQFVAVVQELRAGHRNEAPVLRPGRVIDAPGQFDLVVVVVQAQLPQVDTA